MQATPMAQRRKILQDSECRQLVTEKKSWGGLDPFVDKSTRLFVSIVILFSIKGTNSALDSMKCMSSYFPSLLRAKPRIEDQVLHSPSLPCLAKPTPHPPFSLKARTTALLAQNSPVQQHSISAAHATQKSS